jgi:NADPH-dependent glutamate synthase beta subunit-like oxidoreductase
LQKVLTDPENALKEDSLWLCAWCYKCHERCPQGLKPPEVFQLLKNEAVRREIIGGFRKAVSSMEKAVPLPAICWHMCFHPERAEISEEELGDALRRITSRHKPSKKKETAADGEEKVAVVGSGPAGLVVANELREKGYSVTVFEALQAPGGMLRKTIPEYRLPRKLLDAEIERLRDLGVEIRSNARIGKDIDFGELRKESFKAIFIGIGAHKSRKLGIEGEGLEGVVDALEFLWKVNTQQKVALGRKVGVIGGGNVAVDVARTALRQGAEETVILYRRTREEMPANSWEVMEAEREGVKIEFLIAPTKVLEKDGKATGLKCIKMKLVEPDETGRGKPVPIEGSDFTLQLDTIIVAIGEEVEADFLPKEVEVDKNHRILVDPITMQTSAEGVFAGGDAVSGPATLIEAILAGKRAACSIINYLENIKQKEEKNRGD